LFIIPFTLVFLLGCSCTPTPTPDIKVEGIQPIWGTKLNNGSGIYNSGIAMPIYDGNIIFHSTYFSGFINDDIEEDNRIHSLDMETGKIQWTYPATYNKNKPMLFGGVPYQHNEFIVTKMRKQGSIESDKIVGINLKTGKEMWYKEISSSSSYNTSPDIVGFGDVFYYFEQTRKNVILCKGNIFSGLTQTSLIVEPELGYNFSTVSSNLVFHKEKNLIITGAWEQDTINKDYNASKNYLYIIDITTNSLVNKVFSDSFDSHMSIAHIYCNGDKVYAACGLTTICYNLNTQTIDWTYKSTESYNYMANDVVVNNNIVFLFGSNRYIGLDAQTGEKIYQGDIGCGNVNAFNGYVYIISNDGYFYILDIKTNKKLHRIICPERALPNPQWGGVFSTSCKPQVYGDKLYVFSCTSAYCYDAVPKEE